MFRIVEWHTAHSPAAVEVCMKWLSKVVSWMKPITERCTIEIRESPVCKWGRGETMILYRHNVCAANDILQAQCKCSKGYWTETVYMQQMMFYRLCVYAANVSSLQISSTYVVCTFIPHQLYIFSFDGQFCLQLSLYKYTLFYISASFFCTYCMSIPTGLPLGAFCPVHSINWKRRW